MSSPYVYNSQPIYDQTPYLEPYYNQTQASPFIPDATLYPSSPYTAPTTPTYIGAPLPNTPRRVRFSDLEPEYGTWDGLPRPRRPSWHGSAPSAPLHYTPPSPFNPPLPSYFTQRRHSFGGGTTPYAPYQPSWGGGPVTGGYLSPWGAQAPVFHINPFLNGEAPRSDFLFNLSSPHFAPLRLVGPGQSALLSGEELQQPATHPPLTRLRIVCDMIPQWPIDLEYNPQQTGYGYGYGGAPPPITLGDVLVAVHRGLHQRISQIDWAHLNASEEIAVARAYTRRCKSVPTAELLERSQGVKRVDYLLERVWFRGLVRTGEGWETLKMIVA